VLGDVEAMSYREIADFTSSPACGVTP